MQRTLFSIVMAGLLLGTLSDSFAAQAAAKPTEGVFTVIGTGNSSCGQHLSNKILAEYDHAWVSGFLTGVNGTKGARVGHGTDSDSRELWIDNYCRAHPLEDIADAALSLYIELMNKEK